MLHRHVAAVGDLPLPGTPAGPNGLVRLWRFTANTFKCVFEIPWDELPLRDESLPSNQQVGSPCGHGAEEGQTEEESRASWQKWYDELLARYKPVELDSWDGYSDVWTAPPWISGVSMKIGCRRGGEIAYDVLHAGRKGNVEDGGTLMLYQLGLLG